MHVKPGLRAIGLATTLAAAPVLVSCGGSPASAPPALPYADPGFAEAGAYRLHYALTPTRDLPPDIAGSYGIEPRRNLALLTLVLVPRDATSGKRIDTPQLEATAIALTGGRTPLRLASSNTAGSATWLATVAIRHRVPLTIEIRARATATSPETTVRLVREFRLD